MRMLSAKWFPKSLNADQKRQLCQSSEQISEFFWRDPNDFLSRLVTMDETWLYHYDPKTKQQSMEWRHSGSPRSKNSECKNPLENFSPRFFGIKTASSSLIIFQWAKLLTLSITHLCWCNWRTFEWNTPWEGHQGGLVLARHCPGSPGTCNPEEIGLSVLPMSWSPPYSPDLAPSDYHLFPGLKNNWKFAIFLPDRRSLLPRRTGWADNFLNFLKWLAKVRATV